MGASKTRVSHQYILLDHKVVAWPNLSKMARVYVNHVTNFWIFETASVTFGNIATIGASGLRLRRSSYQIKDMEIPQNFFN
jgi:hypothetical protein